MEKKDLMRLIGNNVRRYRIDHNMTQDELANLVGKNPSAITRIEGGSRMMSVQMLLTVADALNVSCDALLRESCASTRLENICQILSRESEDSLTHLEAIIQVLVQEYGSNKENS